jgi:hypothetical protein
MSAVSPAGLFEVTLEDVTLPIDYRFDGEPADRSHG